jgi:hypothetical protein
MPRIKPISSKMMSIFSRNVKITIPRTKIMRPRENKKEKEKENELLPATIFVSIYAVIVTFFVAKGPYNY